MSSLIHSLSNVLRFIKFDKVCQVVFQSLQSLSGCCENVYNSWADNDDITKLAAIILTQATLNFQNVYDSSGKITVFYKHNENPVRFEGNSWKSLDESNDKEAATTNNISEQWSPKTPVIGTFQGNPCAKITSCKSAKTVISTFAEKPETKPTTTKGTVWEVIVFTCIKTILFPQCMKILRREQEKSPTWSTWLNNNYF